MYKLTNTNGSEIGLTDNIVYVQKQNGKIVTTKSKSRAFGVVFKNILYDLRDIIISEMDSGVMLTKQQANAEDMLCEIDSAYENRIASIEDALCELDAGGMI